MKAGKGRCVFLVGMRGAGKSTVGAELARILGTDFVDCDSRLEARQRISIREIFERFGEERFRLWEREVIVEVLAGGAGVVATGGGAVLRDDTIADLRAAGTVVYLRARPDTLAARVAADARAGARRPSLLGLPPEREVERLLREREPRYRRAADLVVETGDRPAEEIAREIERSIDRGADPRSREAPDRD